MSKQNTTPRASAESLFKELESMESKAQAAIDGLLEEKKTARMAFESKIIHVDEQIKRLDEVYKAASGRYYIGTGHREKPGKGLRLRRSKEEMQADAQEIVAFIAKAGKEGVKGGEIRGQFPKVGPNIVKFVEDNGGGKLTTTGQKSLMKYYVE